MPDLSATQTPYRSYAHARQRAAERYGLILGPDDMQAIADRIADDADDVIPFPDRVKDGAYQVAVWHDTGWLLVVWCPGFRHVLTVLPPSMLDKHEAAIMRWEDQQCPG